MKISRIRGIFASALAVLMLTGGGWMGKVANATQATTVAPIIATRNAGIGFFAPDGIRPELVSIMQFSAINAYSVDQVQLSLAQAKGTSFKVNIDLGPVMAQPMPSSDIKMDYQDLQGKRYAKILPPLSPSKLRQFPSDAKIKTLIAPYLDVMARHVPNVGTVFLADEPYLNGISRSEMERAGAVVRQELNGRKLRSVKLGVIFASGMFDQRFATLLDQEAGEYAKSIDQYYQNASQKWIKTIRSSRLTTYDTAGNMYTGGGIPKGFDVVGFDFYLSTLLLDGLHQHSLSWFASHVPDAGCAPFAGQTMTQIRAKLSFFDHNAMRPGTQVADRALLDTIYQCRMQATTTMLQNELAASGRKVQLLMISESINNGVLEFYADGRPKQGQPALLVEARVLDEVRRAQRFFQAHQSLFLSGLMFFVYESTYDKTINLNIGGASAMPSVMGAIRSFAAEMAAN